MKKLKFLQGCTNRQERTPIDFPGVVFIKERKSKKKEFPHAIFQTTLQPPTARSSPPLKLRRLALSVREVFKRDYEIRQGWSPTCKQLSERIASIYRKSGRKSSYLANRETATSTIIQDVTIDRLRLHSFDEKKRPTKKPSLKKYLEDSSTFPQQPRRTIVNHSVMERPYASVKLETLRPWTNEGFRE